VIAVAKGNGNSKDDDEHKHQKAEIRKMAAAQQACEVVGQSKSTWKMRGGNGAAVAWL